MAEVLSCAQPTVTARPKLPIQALLTPPDTPPSEATQSAYFESDTSVGLDISSSKSATVAVIGVGYVGLHLVEAFSSAYNVIALDVSERRVQELRQHLRRGNVNCTSDPSLLSQASHILIAVSTSTTVDHNRRIDTYCIENACQMVKEHARPGCTVVIESSVAVGMTRQLLQPLAASKFLRCGFSPERVDPGRAIPLYTDIPKIVAGFDSESLEAIRELYSPVFPNLVPVSSPEVAEMTKLYENCQRMMCIAFANEMADACHKLSETLSNGDKQTGAVVINPWEVSQAAATKPFGYMPYTPSLGVGGHCIPVNPYYLLANSDFPLLQACTERMQDRPARIGDIVMSRIRTQGNVHRPRVLVVGLGFKRGQSVLSNSPGRALAFHILEQYDAHVEFADPLVGQDAVPIPRLDTDVEWTLDGLHGFDSVVVAVDQPGLDMSMLKCAESQGLYVEWYCSPNLVVG